MALPPPPRRTRPKAERPKPRPTVKPPPTTVRPGTTHKALAASTLEALRERVRNDSQGKITLDVGILPDTGEVLAPVEGPEPYEILARLYAHIWHRIPLARSVAKKFEGTGNSTGIFADFISLVFALLRRNERIAQDFTTQVVREFGNAMEENAKNRKEKRKSRKPRFGRKEPTNTTPEGQHHA